MKTMTINVIIGSIFGLVTSLGGIGLHTWQYWVLLACLLGAIINNLMSNGGE